MRGNNGSSLPSPANIGNLNPIAVFDCINSFLITGEGLGNGEAACLCHQHTIHMPAVCGIHFEHMPPDGEPVRRQLRSGNGLAVDCDGGARFHHVTNLPEHFLVRGEVHLESILLAVISLLGHTCGEFVHQLIMGIQKVCIIGGSQNNILHCPPQVNGRLIQVLVDHIGAQNITIGSINGIRKEIDFRTGSPTHGALRDGGQCHEEVDHGGIGGLGFSSDSGRPLGFQSDSFAVLGNGIGLSGLNQIIRIPVNHPAQEGSLSQVSAGVVVVGSKAWGQNQVVGSLFPHQSMLRRTLHQRGSIVRVTGRIGKVYIIGDIDLTVAQLGSNLIRLGNVGNGEGHGAVTVVCARHGGVIPPQAFPLDAVWQLHCNTCSGAPQPIGDRRNVFPILVDLVSRVSNRKGVEALLLCIVALFPTIITVLVGEVIYIIACGLAATCCQTGAVYHSIDFHRWGVCPDGVLTSAGVGKKLGFSNQLGGPEAKAAVNALQLGGRKVVPTIVFDIVIEGHILALP